MTRYRFDSKKNFTVLDLFSGIGGFSLGLEATGAFSTVAFCEQDRFCQAVLRKHWPNTPIFDDIRTLPTDRFRGVDICVGGFPCQPWSTAGQRRGAEDDRDLWPEMLRVIEAVQAEWVIGENVRGFVNEPLGLRRSLSDLESIGYEAVTFIIPACSVNAPHRRDRCWIIGHKNVGHTKDNRRHRGAKEAGREGPKDQPNQPRFGVRSQSSRPSQDVGDTKYNGLSAAAIRQGFDQASNNDSQGQNSPIQFERAGQPQNRVTLADTDSIGHERQWSERHNLGSARLCSRKTKRQKNRRFSEQCLGLPPDGLSRWVAGNWERGIPRVTKDEEGRAMKLKALGNSVVPQVVEQIGRAIVSAYD